MTDFTGWETDPDIKKIIDDDNLNSYGKALGIYGVVRNNISESQNRGSLKIPFTVREIEEWLTSNE